MHIFDRFCGFLIQKGTDCEILNLKTGGTCYLTKMYCDYDGGNPTKSLIFERPDNLWSDSELKRRRSQFAPYKYIIYYLKDGLDLCKLNNIIINHNEHNGFIENFIREHRISVGYSKML